MFHAVDLMAGASPPEWRPPPSEPLAAVAQRVRGRVHPVDDPNVRALRFPRDARLLAPLTQAIEACADESAALADIAAALTNPHAVLPAPVSPDGGRRYALVRVVVDPDDPSRARLIVVRVNQAPLQLVWCQ